MGGGDVVAEDLNISHTQLSIEVVNTTATVMSLPVTASGTMDHELSHGFSTAARTTDIHTAPRCGPQEDGPQYGAATSTDHRSHHGLTCICKEDCKLIKKIILDNKIFNYPQVFITNSCLPYSM